MKKGAQFFLVAAFIIVAILFGLGAVYTSTVAPKEDTMVYDLSKEASFEGGQIIDNGMFRAVSQDEISKNILNISEYYYKKNPESELVVVYGTRTGLNAKVINSSTAGTVGVSSGGLLSSINIAGTSPSTNSLLPAPIINTVTGMVNVAYEGNNYEFDLGEGQSFFLIIKVDEDEETIVAQAP